MSETDGPATVDVALAVPVKSGKLLVARRPAGGHLAGQWEFPGGKVDPGEQPEGTARRELQEETGLTVTDLEQMIEHGLMDPALTRFGLAQQLPRPSLLSLPSKLIGPSRAVNGSK